MERTFLDTNVLVYADDLDAGPKREVAREVLREALVSGCGVVSTQVLQEFFVITTGKLGVDPAAAREKVALLGRLDLVVVRLELILGAIDLLRIHRLAFWDALVVKAAAAAGCTRLLTEDLNAGEVIDGVRVVNPFAGA
ncbi:MAG: PIN domain-containing protein [Nitrospirae bacterium]|nr:MAG: PIN domain-containing protein [Nitrospirota bacterium]